MKFSVSQIKKFMKSKAEWAGTYILGIKEDIFILVMVIGKGVHKCIECYNKGKSRDDAYDTGIEFMVECIGSNIITEEEKEKIIEEYEICICNYRKLQESNGFDRHESAESFINITILGIEFIGYVDAIDGDDVIDYKTVGRITTENTASFGGSGLKPMEEYELQAWVYMLATKKKKAKFIEILKKVFKTKSDAGNIIVFERSDEWNNLMEDKFFPVIEEMSAMFIDAGKRGVIIEKW